MMRKKKSICSTLKHRLTLQQEVQTPDGQGGFTRSWQDVAQLWAEIMPQAGSTGAGAEQLAFGQLQPRMTHRILLRYRVGVTPAMRLVFDGRVFNIRSVANKGETNEVLEIMAEEGVAA